MRRTSRKTALAGAAALALLAVPTAALADQGGGHDGEHGGDLLRSGIAGSSPTSAGGATLFGVLPGGAPWVTEPSAVRVRRDGRIALVVDGLVIPVAPFNGTNPVASVMVTLYCNGAAAATTPAFPLSAAGDGRFEGRLALPATCVAPVVLVNPAGNGAVYIAASG